MKTIHLHAAIAACWITIGLAIAITTALIGNQETVIAKQRGADLTRRSTLSYQADRLRAAVNWQTSPPILRETMRRIGLATENGASVASR